LKEERRKKANADQEASLVEKALTVTSQTEIPAATLVKETAVKDAEKVVEFAEAVKNLATKETGELIKAAMEVKRERAASSEAGTLEAVASEATRVKSSSHNTSNSIIDLDSKGEKNTRSGGVELCLLFLHFVLN